MSMNLFFLACTQHEIEEMKSDHSLIDQWVEDEKYIIGTDIETARDVLGKILDGQGIHIGEEVDDALFNGCNLITADEVKDQARQLSEWTREQILDRLQNMEDASEAYRIETYRGDEKYLVEQFDTLLAFYREAAEKGCGVVSYAA